MWDQKLVKWQRHNVGRKLPKNIFATFVAETWRDTNAHGFQKAGIIPFNSNVIP